MIESIIRYSVDNRLFVLLVTLILTGVGIYSLKQTPVDAIPDLSDVQVIVKTSYPGQAPQVVQDQVTYPLTTALMSVPGATTVRGFSFYGDSYIYVIFNDQTDLYWARSRVLESLSQVAATLPPQARPQLGPDASGVGWIYMYALVDKSGQHDLSQLRSLQDFFLKYELQTVPGVSEIASLGGMVKQYQITLNPEQLRAYNIPLSHIHMAISRANQETGASVIEMAEAEYSVRTSGYIKNIQDIENIPLGLSGQGIPILLKNVAQVKIGPQMRRGIAELNGQGESVGGVVVMRTGENAQKTIAAVKEKLRKLKTGLPDGVEVVPVYDRSMLIKRAIENLRDKLFEELVLVSLVCIVFLLHVRSALVAVISLPIGILCAFILMRLQGLNANIMSLGGIAIAIGAMVDGAIVLIENMHKHLEKGDQGEKDRWKIVADSAAEVGPALFFSLLIITVSFIPVFTLEAQEGRMFSPLAFTKTYAMAAAAILAITLVPVLMGYFIRGKIRGEKQNPLNRLLVRLYAPVLKTVLTCPRQTLLIALILLLSSLWPITQIGSEFMPGLDEGDLVYMPTTYPGISIGKARELLQQTDKLLRTVPEVKTVFGKVGRADTATDPAPLTMIETFIQLKPRKAWRRGMTLEKLKSEMNSLVSLPGVSNAWVMPIKMRIDMLSTGIKTPLGIKISGPNLETIQVLGQQLETILQDMDSSVSVYSERVVGGRYIKIDIDREQAARFGLNIVELQQIIQTAIGGVNITWSVEGLERYPVNMRYPQSFRNSPESLQKLPILTPSGQSIALADVARVYIEDGPPGIKSENARLVGWTLVDIDGAQIGKFVKAARARVAKTLKTPPGYSLTWSGNYEYMQRAYTKLAYIVPLTLAIILSLLYLNFRNFLHVAILLGTLPFSLIGSFWCLYWLGYEFSIAVGVGFIALAGLAVETGVLMLVYLNQAYSAYAKNHNATVSPEDLQKIVLDGASLRLRPVLMTASATIIGLLPILFGKGTGSELMSRLAAPMVGGMITAVLLTLIIVPLVYFLTISKRR